jgi:hypothetical protein
MAYDPVKAFLGGMCDTFAKVPPVEARRFARLGWPSGPGLGEAAFRAAMRELAAAPSKELMDRHDRLIAEAQAEDDRRLARAVSLSFAGQWTGFGLAVSLIVGTCLLAKFGHDTLAFLPIGALAGAMIGARLWLDRQADGADDGNGP